GSIGTLELAAAHERDAQGAEVSEPHFVESRVAVDVRARLEPFDLNVISPIAPREDGNERRGDARHARHRGQIVLVPLAERCGTRGLVPVELRRDAERNDVVDVEPEIHTTHIAKTLHEESG